MTLTNPPPNLSASTHQQPPHISTAASSHRPSLRFSKPVSLRTKLLIGFSMVFSIVFAGTFYWFYQFTTEKTLSRLQADMEATLKGAAQGVDVEELMALYNEGQPNAEGFSDDPRYHNQLKWFQTVQSIEPRVWLYSYIIRREGETHWTGLNSDNPQRLEMVFLVDLWAVRDPEKAAPFLAVENPGTPRWAILDERIRREDEIYTDDWGAWISAYAPLRDANGNVVAGLGLDIEADYVFQVQQAIRNRVLVSFGITYGVLFILIYTLSGILTRNLVEFTESAEKIGAGDYGVQLSRSHLRTFPDEMDRLAQVLQSMVESIRTREQMIIKSKRIEDEIRHALKAEKETNELKSRFVSMVSHELRTPLTIIRTSTELLEKYGHQVTEEKKQEYYHRIRSAISTMTQLLEDVLTLGKAEAGRLEFNPMVVNLDYFCREIVEEMRMGLGIHHTIEFECLLGCEQAFLDPALMRSILTNLLSNAIKYSRSNSTVKLRLHCQDGVALIEIQDEGIGIPKEDQPRLFELFHRASNVSTIRGTGLGLAILKQCVAHHQGQVRFKSQEGVGTTFTIQLPIKPPLMPSDA
ncbi:MAG: sensor histidine kinase [Leptolyngbya sp. DLM2.Bin15]|nr:MAG: sensor histidine kinase [Leptolyngbya sp. DLM2.Bin15]